MSLRQHMSKLASGWEAAHRIARAIVRLESYMTIAALEEIKSSRSAGNPLLAFGAKHYSQNDEDGLIEEITRRTIGEHPGTFLELGVGNGLENNTLNLLAKGWRGAWLGGEELAFACEATRLRFRQCWIDKDNIASLCRETLDAHGIDQPDLLSVDLTATTITSARACSRRPCGPPCGSSNTTRAFRPPPAGSCLTTPRIAGTAAIISAPPWARSTTCWPAPGTAWWPAI